MRRTKWQQKEKILALISSGRGLALKDGKIYTGAGLLPQRSDGFLVRALMKEGYENHLRQPHRVQYAAGGGVHSEVVGFFGGDAAKLQDYLLFRDGLLWAQKSSSHQGCHRVGPGSI